jgi:O-antigen/teichoic acid export membrane protein/Ser/Thr protein kinase RdoA (MazF antagonist)
MQSLRNLVGRYLKPAGGDSLLRNAIFLMASTGIMSVLGFGFWIFVAHLYSPGAIGEASALISITLLISNLSFFGLNAAFVRFLPTSKNQSRDINAALITVSLATIVAGIVYLSFAPHFAGKLGWLMANPGHQLLFLFLLVAVSLNTLTDSIFIANRRAEYHTIVYTVFGVVKLILPLLLISSGALGIFTSYIAAVIASLALSFYFMKRATGYRILSRPNWVFISKSRHYTISNYLGALLWGLPSQLMPTLIIARLGDVNAAYFSMAWTMANLLYVIPSATTNSLLAETSHNMADQSKNLRHAIRILALILVPVVALSIIVAPYLLSLFGGNYARGGTHIFQLLALSTFFIAGSSIGNTIMNIEQRVKGIVGVQIITASTTLLLATVLVRFGLVGIGLSMLLGNMIGFSVQVIILRRSRRKHKVIGSGLPNRPSLAVTRAMLSHYDLGEYQIGADLGGGDRSSTYIVSTQDKKYVVKIYRSDKRSVTDIEDELRFTAHLAQVGIPTARVVPAKDGARVTQYSADGADWCIVLVHFESGQTPGFYTPELITSMARIQANIHALGIAYSAESRGVSKNRMRARFLSGLLFFGPKGLSHFDYDGTNILVDDDYNVACVIDFEGMRYDYVAVCIVYTLIRLHLEDKNIALIENYLRVYQDVRSLSWAEKISIRLALATRYRSVRMLTLHY